MSEVDARRLDRRQLLKAGAWAAPAVVLATAVPAASASVPATPVNIRLTANCAPTGVGADTNHGFTIWNASDETAVVVVFFLANAWGLLRTTAIRNVISATTAPSATYEVIPENSPAVPPGWTYQTLWETADRIATSTARSGLGFNARREGEATFVLAPGASVQFVQINTNALGEPMVTAHITSINGDIGPGQIAAFRFEWGGACIT